MYLHIHIKKYGYFGISFSKAFLIQKGVNPVFYVALNSLIPESVEINPTAAEHDKNNRIKRSAYFDRMFELYQAALYIQRTTLPDGRITLIGPGGNSVESLSGFAQKLADFLNFYILSFLKPFEANPDDSHNDNYYMERERRSLEEISFTLSDITCVYLPEKYKDMIVKEFPYLQAIVKVLSDGSED